MKLFNVQSRRSAAAAAVALLGGAVALLGLSPSPASADPLPPNLSMYANCPVDNPAVASCVYIKTTNARLKVGKFDLRTQDPITLEFGLRYDENYNSIAVSPSNGAKILHSPPIAVPGGVLGIPGAGVGPLAAYVTPELTALPTIDINNLVLQQGTVLGLKLKAKVHNPFTDVLSVLGPGCYIGSNTHPIALNLTTGTTSPPPPNQPISGVYHPGTAEGWGIRFDGVRAVDNAFAAPGASGCGTPLGYLNPTVNAIAGVPSPAGTNTAVLDTTVHITDANEVREALGMEPVYQ
ncbi:hypothetical protein GCM10022237_00840 [Nocardioides ginsengisoli]|uniref:Uncharacterized protein n=1 Tax=Nocardioides ginsengisoli TaxID=363868 RepID=A0ABW3W3D8_9ACTN